MSLQHTLKPRILIIGGGYAGLSTAHRLSRHASDLAITLIDVKPQFEERIRLHQVAAGQMSQRFSYQNFLESLGVSFLQGKVKTIDPDANEVMVEERSGTVTKLAYDYLVYALGSVMDVHTTSGVSEYACVFDTVMAAEHLYAQLEQTPDAQVLVVGGGLTGIETATELAESMPLLQISLLTSEPLQARAEAGGYSEKAVAYMMQALSKRQIELHSGARVVELRAGVACMSDGSQHSFDICIWTSGFKPSALATQAGIQVNDHGQIVVDDCLRSVSHPNIIAVGDAASVSTSAAGACRMGSATALAMGPSGARTIVALLKQQTPPVFRFKYLFRNICFGRDDGLIQFVDSRDYPRSIVWTGAAAAEWKEYVCQETLSMVGIHSSSMSPVIPPLRMLPQLIHGLKQYA